MGIFILGASPTQALAAHLVLVDRNLHMAKTRLVNYDSPWDLDQIGNKTCYIPKVSNFYVERVSTVLWIPGNVLGSSEKAYLENPCISFGIGIPWKNFSSRFKYLDSLEKFVVVVVVVALVDGCSFPEVRRTFHESTRKL